MQGISVGDLYKTTYVSVNKSSVIFLFRSGMVLCNVFRPYTGTSLEKVLLMELYMWREVNANVSYTYIER